MGNRRVTMERRTWKLAIDTDVEALTARIAEAIDAGGGVVEFIDAESRTRRVGVGPDNPLIVGRENTGKLVTVP